MLQETSYRVPGGETPFKVVFKKGDTVIVEWPVESKEAGEEEIVEVLEFDR